MRFTTVLMFLFIFVAWYAVYQMFFSFIINISFVLSIALVVWAVRKVKGFGNMFRRKEPKKLFLRRAV